MKESAERYFTRAIETTYDAVRPPSTVHAALLARSRSDIPPVTYAALSLNRNIKTSATSLGFPMRPS